MARLCNAATDRVELGAGNLFSGATGSGTFSCWAKPATAHATETVFLGVGGAAASNAALWLIEIEATEKVLVQSRTTNGGTNNFITSDGSLTLNAWNHVLVKSSGSAWSIWINGSSQTLTVGAGSNAGEWIGDCAPASGTKTELLGLFFNGIQQLGCINVDVAEIALWNGAELDANEIAALAAAVSPRLIRPQSLSAYWDLVNAVFDWREYRAAQTITGTSVTAHPRIYVPTRPLARVTPTPIPTPGIQRRVPGVSRQVRQAMGV